MPLLLYIGLLNTTGITLKPLVLLVVTLVAAQALLNLINDWNKEPEVHTAADDIDKDEIERLKKSVGEK